MSAMASRLPLLITIAGVAVLFLAIAFVFVLVIGAMFFGGIEFTGGHSDAAALAGALRLVA
ncbi:hypothetical protein B0I12_001427 [Microbacterium hydrothermale]|nr:hypothetical protein [Microbacterium hydrothermale]